MTKSGWVKGMMAALVSAICVVGTATAAEAPASDSAAATQEIKAQTTCPIAGGAIDKKLYVDAKGYRIYVCCAGCIAKVKADPDAALAKIKANGETAEKAPAASAEAGTAKNPPSCCRPK
jgi:hypothetical protein